jgi:hypothetical protein
VVLVITTLLFEKLMSFTSPVRCAVAVVARVHRLQTACIFSPSETLLNKWFAVMRNRIQISPRRKRHNNMVRYRIL